MTARAAYLKARSFVVHSLLSLQSRQLAHNAGESCVSPSIKVQWIGASLEYTCADGRLTG